MAQAQMATETAMAESLLSERKVFEDSLAQWRPEHTGQYVLIKGTEVVGFFDSLDNATREGFKRFGLNDFFVTRIDPPNAVNVSFLGQRF
jgi:hypothetical protein